jgi:hypothetical protein
MVMLTPVLGGLLVKTTVQHLLVVQRGNAISLLPTLP